MATPQNKQKGQGILTLNRDAARRAVLRLGSWHIFIIAASNYLVQIPLSLGPIHATWGAFTFPFIFLTTDLTARIFGAHLARRIIFVCMFPAIIISYLVSLLFVGGDWQGFGAVFSYNSVVSRIALASFTAYALGQFLDITVFNRLRRATAWWLAPSAAAIVGNGLDTLVFFFLAFYQSADPFMAEYWQQIAWVDYGFKLFISALFFLPLYGILLNYLTRRVLR